eukprot:TRINITY_DN14962_c0_g1_i1.p1 TRINITY_DN14962_c0_g1~~TRINITY_DN14962_c0_g1_i1.p1  ORF type:complete len:626 (-),score=194.35 TRINITY_DN14962_c0_g1_i1:156-2033(-)
MAPARRTKLRRPAAKAAGKKKPGGKGPARSSSCSSSYYSGSSRSGSEGSSSDGNSDEDDPRDYKRGGYHPVMPYQLYNSRYRVLSKLGAGAFSTVWLCADEKKADDGPFEIVAMKVCKSKKSVSEQARDEVLLLERLFEDDQESPHVVQMRGHFWHSGPNGRHKCMVFQVMGENLLALVKHFDYNGLPLALCRRLARHTLLGLEYIHERGVLHTDVKLENVLIQRHDMAELVKEAQKAHRAFMEQRSGLEQLSKSQKKRQKQKAKKAAAKEATGEGVEDGNDDASKEVAPAAVEASNGKDADGAPEDSAAASTDQAAANACGRPIPPVRQRERFGTLKLEETFASLADFGNGIRVNKPVTDDIQTRQYRSPEVIIGAKWDETADVWSAACMLFELATGDFLFDPRSADDWDRDEDHLALMAELLEGLPPKEYALSGKYSKDFFLNSGKLKHIKNLKLWPLIDVLKEKYKFSQEDAAEMNDFLLPMLAWQPKDRQQAKEALKHKWLEPREGETCVVPAERVRKQSEDSSESEDEDDEEEGDVPKLVAVPAETEAKDADAEKTPSKEAPTGGYPSAASNGTAPPLAPAPSAVQDACGDAEDDDEEDEAEATGKGDGAKKKKKKKGKK